MTISCKVYIHDETRTLESEIEYFIEKKPVLYNCEISNIKQIHHIVWSSDDSHLTYTPIQNNSMVGKLLTRFGENVMAVFPATRDLYQAYHPYQINGTKSLLSYEMGYNAKD